MIKTTGFKRAFLMPSNRRPIFASVNDAVRGYTIRSDGFITAYPCPAYYSYTISSRCRRSNYNPIPSHLPSQIRYNVKPETFNRLFLLPWK